MKRTSLVLASTTILAAFLIIPLLAQQPAAQQPAAQPQTQTPAGQPPAPGGAAPQTPAGAPPAAGRQGGRGQQPRYQVTAADKQQIQAKLTELEALIAPLKAKRGEDDLMADVEVHAKAARWALEFPEDVAAQADVPNLITVMERGIERAKLLAAGQSPWVLEPGTKVLAYYSPLDGSVQPYRINVPQTYDHVKPVPLYGWMHGRQNTLTTATFIFQGNMPSGTSRAPDLGQIEVAYLGRGNNANHWAGEVDVYETNAAAQRRFKIDPKRIVLRGFSLGGAAAWHLALHNPSMFVAAEIGAGTWPRRYTMMDEFPPHQRPTLRIWENIPEWALNTFNLPIAGHGGDGDNQIPSIPGPPGYPNVANRGQLESSLRVRAQLEKEGFPSEGEPNFLRPKGTPSIFLISDNTAHSTNALTRERINAFLTEWTQRGQVSPDHIRFLTYTTRYNKNYWVSVDGMEKHYERAEIEAQRTDAGKTYRITTKNISRLTLQEMRSATDVTIDGQALKVRGAQAIALEKGPRGWRTAPLRWAGLHKTHRLQGPIDDAFLDPFLLVRPTGTPWNEASHQLALKRLADFDRSYARRYFAHPRIKDDKDVTEADFVRYNVVLFGDPGSNRWISRVHGRLPIRWSKESVTVAGKSYPAADHLPVLAYPGPINPARYVVLNSGLTFPDNLYNADYSFPHLGDIAVLQAKPEGEPATAFAGFFDETWKLPATTPASTR